MHSVDEKGKICVDLEQFSPLSDSIRLRKKIDYLMELYNCPKEIPYFSITLIFRSGKRFYISNLYLWAIAYRTQGYYRGDVDHDFNIYNKKEFFIPEDIPKDDTQETILRIMKDRYKLYTNFAMVRQCSECDLIIEAYNNEAIYNPNKVYSQLRDQFEKFIIGFLSEYIPDIAYSLKEEYCLNFFQDKEFRKKVIQRELPIISTKLTDRELQCLFLVSQGKHTKDIAHRLSLSVETIQTHLKAVRRKLQCNNITQSVVVALKTDLFKNINYPFLGIE